MQCFRINNKTTNNFIFIPYSCLLVIGFLFLFFFTSRCLALPEPNTIYFGVALGYGSTTWQGLVPAHENQNLATSLSTPIRVKEGGVAEGGFIGYEFFCNFAIEASYTHYPNATIFFDNISLFSFDNNQLTNFITHTEAFALIGKIFVPINGIALYSTTGVAKIHRKDMLLDAWRISPIFGGGISYPLNKFFEVALAADYIAGFGESQLSPANSYFPFLYAVNLKLAYYF